MPIIQDDTRQYGVQVMISAGAAAADIGAMVASASGHIHSVLPVAGMMAGGTVLATVGARCAGKLVRRRRWATHDPLGVVPDAVKAYMAVRRHSHFVSREDKYDGGTLGFPEGYVALAYQPYFLCEDPGYRVVIHQIPQWPEHQFRHIFLSALGDNNIYHPKWAVISRWIWYRENGKEFSGFAQLLVVRSDLLPKEREQRLQELRAMRTMAGLVISDIREEL